MVVCNPGPRGWFGQRSATHVEFQCEKGHVFTESPGLLANRKSCPCSVDWGWQRGYRSGVRVILR
jgi:hypothetical protein